MDALPLTLFDVGVLAVVLLSALIGLVRGGIAEILGLASWIGAGALAVLALPQVRPFAREAAGNDLVADAAALVGGFIVGFLLLKLVTAMVSRAVAASSLGSLDRVLGVAFGAARGGLLVCAIYLLVGQFIRPELHPPWVKDALLIDTVREATDRLTRLIPPSAEMPPPPARAVPSPLPPPREQPS